MTASERAQQFAQDNNLQRLLIDEVQKSGFVTSAGYKAVLQRQKFLYTDVVADEGTTSSTASVAVVPPARPSLVAMMSSHRISINNDDSGTCNKPTRRRRPRSISESAANFGSMIASGLTASTMSSSLTASLSSVCIDEFDDYILPPNESSKVASCNDNLAPRRRSDYSIEQEDMARTQQDETREKKQSRRPHLKKLNSVKFDPPQDNTQDICKDDTAIADHDTKSINNYGMLVKQSMESKTQGQTKQKEDAEVNEEIEFDPQAFLNSLCTPDTKKCIVTDISLLKKYKSEEWLPWPSIASKRHRLHRQLSANSEDNSSSSTNSSQSSAGGNDGGWLAWPTDERVNDNDTSSTTSSKSSLKWARAA